MVCVSRCSTNIIQDYVDTRDCILADSCVAKVVATADSGCHSKCWAEERTRSSWQYTCTRPSSAACQYARHDVVSSSARGSTLLAAIVAAVCVVCVWEREHARTRVKEQSWAEYGICIVTHVKSVESKRLLYCSTLTTSYSTRRVQ